MCIGKHLKEIRPKFVQQKLFISNANTIFFGWKCIHQGYVLSKKQILCAMRLVAFYLKLFLQNACRTEYINLLLNGDDTVACTGPCRLNYGKQFYYSMYSFNLFDFLSKSGQVNK